jgi:hypothetical protein
MRVFALDLLFWCVTIFSLLTLACSATFLVYLGIRKTFEMLLEVPPPGLRLARMRPAQPDMPSRSATVKRIMSAVDRNLGALVRGVDAVNGAAMAGPWGPIDRALSPEIAHKIESVMAVGVGMCDAAGNPCPHPIAPRVALAIVEALHGRP